MQGFLSALPHPVRALLANLLDDMASILLLLAKRQPGLVGAGRACIDFCAEAINCSAWQ